MNWTGAIGQLVLLVIRFAARAIHAFVDTAVDITARAESAPQLQGKLFVLVLRCPNESVVGDVQRAPQALEGGGDLVDVLRRRELAPCSDPFDIDAVLVGAGEQGHVLSSQSVVPSNGVGNDGGVRVPDV